MKRFRVTSALLICAAALALAACGGADDTAPTAGSAPTASAPAALPAPAPASSAPAGTAGGPGDKEICEAVKQAGEDMKSSLITAFQAGAEPSPAVFKKILTDLDRKVTSLAESGGGSKVTAALKKFGAEAAAAAKAADPANAADNPGFEQAGADVTAACLPTGINVNF